MDSFKLCYSVDSERKTIVEETARGETTAILINHACECTLHVLCIKYAFLINSRLCKSTKLKSAQSKGGVIDTGGNPEHLASHTHLIPTVVWRLSGLVVLSRSA